MQPPPLFELFYEEGLHNAINIGSGKAKTERKMYWLDLEKQAEASADLLREGFYLLLKIDKAERWTSNIRHMPAIVMWRKEGEKEEKSGFKGFREINTM